MVVKSYDGKTTKVSRNSQQKKSDAVTNQNDKEIPKKARNYWWSEINVIIE